MAPSPRVLALASQATSPLAPTLASQRTSPLAPVLVSQGTSPLVRALLWKALSPLVPALVSLALSPPELGPEQLRPIPPILPAARSWAMAESGATPVFAAEPPWVASLALARSRFAAGWERYSPISILLQSQDFSQASILVAARIPEAPGQPSASMAALSAGGR